MAPAVVISMLCAAWIFMGPAEPTDRYPPPALVPAPFSCVRADVPGLPTLKYAKSVAARLRAAPSASSSSLSSPPSETPRRRSPNASVITSAASQVSKSSFRGSTSAEHTARATAANVSSPGKRRASAGERRLRDALRNGVSDVGVFETSTSLGGGSWPRQASSRASPAPAVALSSSHARGTIARRSSSDASSQCSRSTAEAEPRASTIVAHLARGVPPPPTRGRCTAERRAAGAKAAPQGHAVVAGIMHPPHSCDSRTPPRAAGSGERRAPRRPVRAMMRLTRASNTFITTPTTFPSSSRPRFSSAPAPPPRTRTR